MTSRIIEESNVIERREALAPVINIHWNPDNTGWVDFNVMHEVTRNGVLQPGLVADPRPEMNPLRVTIADLLPRVFHVPVAFDQTTGEPIAWQDIPCMLLMATIKQAFDDIFSETVNNLELPPPDPEI